MQTPSKGRIVMVPADPHENNGDKDAPALVTRVFGQRPDGGWTVNVRVLFDSNSIAWRTSVALFETEDQARAGGEHTAWWPARV